MFKECVKCIECIKGIIRKIENYFSSGYTEIPSVSAPTPNPCPPQMRWDILEEDMPQYLQEREWELSIFPRTQGQPNRRFIKQELVDDMYVMSYYKELGKQKILMVKESLYPFKTGFFPCQCHDPEHCASDAPPFLYHSRWMKFFPIEEPRQDGTYIHRAKLVIS